MTAYCKERPPERSDESEHSTDPYEMQRWLKSGSRMPKWTKTFSREACLDLIAVAAREGIAFEGETPNAPALEEEDHGPSRRLQVQVDGRGRGRALVMLSCLSTGRRASLKTTLRRRRRRLDRLKRLVLVG